MSLYLAATKWYPEMLVSLFGPAKIAAAEEKNASEKCTAETEKRRSVKIGMELDKLNNVTGFCNISFPRLFSADRSVELKYSTNQDSKLLYRSQHGNSTAELSLFRSFLKTPRKCFETAGLSLKLGRLSSAVELRADLRGPGVLRLHFQKSVGKTTVSCQTGLSTTRGSMFAKAEMAGTKTLSLHRRFYNKVDWGIGVVRGDVHEADRFFLGANIWGYKPQSVYPSASGLDGGVSYVEATDSLGVRTSNFDFFVFSSMGFCSQQSNIVETITSCFLSLFCNTKPRCLGLSLGAGVSSPIHFKGFGERKVQARFAIPLTSNPETETFRLSLVAEL